MLLHCVRVSCSPSSGDARAVVIKMFREETVCSKKQENAAGGVAAGGALGAIGGAIVGGLAGWLLGGSGSNDEGERKRRGGAGSVFAGALAGAYEFTFNYAYARMLRLVPARYYDCEQRTFSFTFDAPYDLMHSIFFVIRVRSRDNSNA